VETSIMLHLRPDLVHMEHARDFKGLLAEVEADFELLRVIGSTYMGWQAQDLHTDGCSGDATGATTEIGRVYVEHITAKLAALLGEISAYPLDRIRHRENPANR
jgi:creatinine amidohydrolase